MALESAELGKAEMESGGVSVTEPEPPEGPNNPMLIDRVIDNMFGYCDFESLRHCRRVSKQWFKVSLPHWLTKGPKIKLLLEIAPMHPGDHRRKEGFRNMSEFLQLVRTTPTPSDEYSYCGLRQYKKFEVEGCPGDAQRRELLEEFFRGFGEFIADLKLTMTFADLDMYQTVMLSRETPNLVQLQACVAFTNDVDPGKWVYQVEHEAQVQEKLKTFRIDVQRYRAAGRLPVPAWVQLLKRYPHLVNLAEGVRFPTRPEDVDNMLEAVLTIRHADKKALDLKRLEVCCASRINEDYRLVREQYYDLESLLPLVRDTPLKLETLAFSVGELTPNQTIYDILDSQVATLKTLLIHYHKIRPLRNFRLPEMGCVNALEIHGRRPFQNLDFLKRFPNLKSLTFCFTGEGDYDELALLLNDTEEEVPEELMIPTLTKLHCNYKNFEGALWPEEHIRKLCRLMPNLTDLQLWLDNKSFRAVCGCWPGLKSLCIIGDEVDDKGIMGRIGRGGNMSPNIGNLKELESFSMTHAEYCFLEESARPAAITGQCVNQLLSLPKLKKLKITLHEDHEREHGHLRNTPVIQVEGREINVNITFAWGPAPALPDHNSSEEDYESEQSNNNGESDDDDGDGSTGVDDFVD